MAKKERLQQKRKREIAKQRELEKQKLEEADLLEESELPMDEPIVDETVSEDMVEKEYDEPMQMMGPTSWEEVDAMRRAEEQAEAVREDTWSLQDMVRGIIHNSMMSPDEKGKAISNAGLGFSKRIKMHMSEKTEKSIDDLDLLEIEALIAKDKRHTPFTETFTDFITKKKLTAAAENALSDSDFALVKTQDGKKIRKYPIHDKAHVRNALARAAQMIAKGGEAATDAKAALPKIKAAAKEMGIGSMEKAASSVVLEKDNKGKWRAIMWPTNNFMDLSGEILSEKAHLEYVDWVNKDISKRAPVFTTWHKSQLVRKNRVDFVGYENGFMIMSAPLEDSEAAVLFKAMKICDVGMSHGTLVLERNKDIRKVIEKYRTVEVSDLPLENADNPFTDFSIISKEADVKIEDYLKSLNVPEEVVKEILGKTETKQAALREAGVQEKEKQEVEAPAESPATDPALPTMDMEALVKAVGESLDIEGLNDFVEKANVAIEKVPVLEETIKALSKNRDEELAEKISPPIEKHFAWSKKNRPSQNGKNILDESEKASEEDKVLKEAKPEVHWLADLAGIEPVKPGG